MALTEEEQKAIFLRYGEARYNEGLAHGMGKGVLLGTMACFMGGLSVLLAFSVKN
jgi:hypothetical protein